MRNMISSLAILMACMLSAACSSFHDRSNLAACPEQREGGLTPRDCSIVGTTLYLNDKTHEAVGWHFLTLSLLDEEKRLVQTVYSDCDGHFEMISVPVAGQYFIRVELRCWETGWHAGVTKRTLLLPIALTAYRCEHVCVTLDCPMGPAGDD